MCGWIKRQSLWWNHAAVPFSRWSALLSGRTRVSVPKTGRVSIIIRPAPDKLHSPVGPVAHFYKEPEMLCSTFLFPCLSVQRSYCSRTCPTTLLLIRQHYILGSASPGEWAWRRGSAESSWGISAMHQSIICGLTQSISPFWQLNHCGYHLMVH